ncbi:MAG: hypothetical protein WAT39_25655 [Planctomycetota bacterium]
MTPAEFEDRLHDLLDARQDPLADAACVQFLAEHPDRLAAFARGHERLAALPAVAPLAAPPGLRRRLPWLLAAAAVAAVTAFARRGTPAPAAVVPAGRVLAASLQPILPTLGAAATVRASTVLLAGPTARLETFTQWSAP